MSIQYAILGLLSWQDMSGYDLKKLFSESLALYWSGNNNQIYKTLVQLHQEGMLEKQVVDQENAPSKKIYRTTNLGKQALKEWVLSQPELPSMKNSFLIQLMWADCLADEDIFAIIRKYEDEVQMQLLMKQVVKEERNLLIPRTPREAILWEMILQNEIGFYQNEISWIQNLKQALRKQGQR